MNTPAQIRKWSWVVLAVVCLLATPLAADEILLNSDFSKDTENWSGDFSNDPSEDNPLDPHSTGQITIDLREHRAVRIFQAFNADTTNLVCNVTFTLSKDGLYTGSAKVCDVASDVNENEIAGNSYNPATGIVTLYTNSNYATYQSSFNAPVLIFADPDDSKVLLIPLASTYAAQGQPGLTPIAHDAITKSYTERIALAHHHSYRLYLAFPPGTGSVTVTKISLQPDDNAN